MNLFLQSSGGVLQWKDSLGGTFSSDLDLVMGGTQSQSLTSGVNIAIVGEDINTVFVDTLEVTGANISITADDIDIAGTATLSTRMISAGTQLDGDSDGNSGDLSLSGQKITVNTGAILVSHATGAFDPGNISLTASDDSPDLIGSPVDVASNVATISITGATFKARDITVSATAEDLPLVDDLPEYWSTFIIEPLLKDAVGLFNEVADSFLLPASVNVRGSEATLTATDTNFTASGNVELSTTANVDASVEALVTRNQTNQLSRLAVAVGTSGRGRDYDARRNYVYQCSHGRRQRSLQRQQHPMSRPLKCSRTMDSNPRIRARPGCLWPSPYPAPMPSR